MKIQKITESVKQAVNESNGQKAVQLYRKAMRVTGWSDRKIESEARAIIRFLWKEAKFASKNKEDIERFPDYNDADLELDSYYERLETMLLNGLVKDIKNLEAVVKQMEEEIYEEDFENGFFIGFSPIKNTEVSYVEGFFLADQDDPDNIKGSYIDILGPQVKLSIGWL